jgi:DNA-binding IclR family transcriptional regulator
MRATAAKKPVETVEAKGTATLERALLILSAFTPQDPYMSLAELSRKTGLNKSTLLRLAQTLQRFGYLGQTPEGNYHVGPAPLYLGSLFQQAVKPGDLVLPALKGLVAKTGESASFNVRTGDVRVCVYRVDSPHRIRDHVKAGDILPLNKGAVGKVLTAFSEPESRGAELAEVRRRLCSVTRAEIEMDTAGIACPVFGVEQKLEGCFALTGPLSRFEPPKIAGMRRLLLEAAATMTYGLGGDPKPLERALKDNEPFPAKNILLKEKR